MDDKSVTIKIVSDGTSMGTKLYTSEGKRITNIRSIRWECSVDQTIATAIVEFILPEVELQVESEDVVARITSFGDMIERYAK